MSRVIGPSAPSPAKEQVDLVDESDRVIGSSTIGECVSKGLLHRAVAVIVLNGRGEMILQRRSKGDRWFPGYWTVSSTGHVRRHEGYPAAARRELAEELGLHCRLSAVTVTRVPKIAAWGMIENEITRVFEGRSDETPRLDPLEVEEIEFVEFKNADTVLRGHRFTPDAKVVLREYVRAKDV